MNALTAEDTGTMFRLAALFLAEHADRLDNDGCNDWEWPAWVPEASRVRILSSMATDPGDAAAVVEAYRTGPPNNVMARLLAEVFEQLGVLAEEPAEVSVAPPEPEWCPACDGPTTPDDVHPIGVATVATTEPDTALIPGDWVYWSDRRVLVLPDRPEDPPHEGYTSVWSPHLNAGGLAPTSLLRREPSKS